MPCPPLATADLDHILAHTRQLWEEARGQSFFITGGTGFFGMWLLESFCHANDSLELQARATVLTRDKRAFALKAPHLFNRHDLLFVEGDVRNFSFPAGRFRFVIHGATEASARLIEEAPALMLDAIVTGTRRTLEFATQAGAEKLLFTSSGAVYGPQPSGLPHIPETHPGTPDPLSRSSSYAIGKLAAEHMCFVHSGTHRFDLKIARCFAFVGPHLPLDTHFAIGNFIGDVLAGRDIRIAGDGTPYRSYLYAADLAIWLWTILFRGRPGRPYNVGSQEGMPLSEIARIVEATLRGERPVFVARPPGDGAASRYVPDVTRAAAELGLHPLVPLDDALRRTVAWYRAAQYKPAALS